MRIALILALALLAAFVAEPYVARYFYASEAPRTVAARGDLAPAEQATTELFQRASPSVVHVFAQPGGGRGLTDPEGEGGGAQTGTGFVWDEAGHIVTNNHVVQGAQGPIAVRLATGETVPAQRCQAAAAAEWQHGGAASGGPRQRRRVEGSGGSPWPTKPDETGSGWRAGCGFAA